MLREVLDIDRFEGALADVQRDLRLLNAARGQTLQQFGREVQSGGRCGDRPGVAREYGLVALAVQGVALVVPARARWRPACNPTVALRRARVRRACS